MFDKVSANCSQALKHLSCHLLSAQEVNLLQKRNPLPGPEIRNAGLQKGGKHASLGFNIAFERLGHRFGMSMILPQLESGMSLGGGGGG